MSDTKSNSPLIQTGSIARNDFKPSPIEPSWIMEGNPTARSVSLAKANDKNFSCGLWECTAGKFKYIFPEDEIVHILEGEVFIQEEGAEHTLRAGDTAYFPEGLITVWTVPIYIKKFAIFRSVSQPLSVKIISRLKKILKRK